MPASPDLELRGLIGGIRLRLPASLTRERVRIFDGVERATSPLYHAPSFVPRLPARAPRPAERDLLFEGATDAAGESIAIVRTPPAIHSAFAPLLRLIAHRAAESRALTTVFRTDAQARDMPAESTHPRLGAAVCHLDDARFAQLKVVLAAAEQFARACEGSTATAGSLQCPGVVARCPGLLTCTYDYQGRRLIGLHIDNFFADALHDRGTAPNRLCINLGETPRYLLFVNLTLQHCRDLLARVADEAARVADVDWRLDQLFLTTYPHYPVVELRIDPGEAYLAPTENMIHDSTTLLCERPDVSLTFLGRFDIRTAASLHDALGAVFVAHGER